MGAIGLHCQPTLLVLLVISIFQTTAERQTNSINEQ